MAPSQSQSQSRAQLLQARARHFRFHPTSTEAALWRQLAGKRLGVAFKRQVVIGRFIVDFFAPSAALVIEVDGGYHALRRRLDARRDAWLQLQGLRVLRLSDDLVRSDIAAAIARISSALHG